MATSLDTKKIEKIATEYLAENERAKCTEMIEFVKEQYGRSSSLGYSRTERALIEKTCQRVKYIQMHTLPDGRRI